MGQSEVLVIEPGVSHTRYWRDLWKYRELFFVLGWRDLSVRYKQTVIGLAWALIRPVLTVATFTIVFGRIARLPSDAGVPYPLLVFAGILPWQFFASAVSESANSVIGNAALVSKVYFPRLIIPMAALVVPIVDLLVTFVLFLLLMAWYGVPPSWRMLAIPIFLGMGVVASVGPGLWVAALNVKYRDFRYVIPFILQLGLYVSPVGFSSSIVPENWRLAYSLNPMVGVIDGFRWAALGGTSSLYLPGIGLGAVTTLVLLLGGVGQFRRTERAFADLI